MWPGFSLETSSVLSPWSLWPQKMACPLFQETSLFSSPWPPWLCCKGVRGLAPTRPLRALKLLHVVVPVAGAGSSSSQLLGHGGGRSRLATAAQRTEVCSHGPAEAHGEETAAELLPGLAPTRDCGWAGWMLGLCPLGSFPFLGSVLFLCCVPPRLCPLARQPLDTPLRLSLRGLTPSQALLPTSQPIGPLSSPFCG